MRWLSPDYWTRALSNPWIAGGLAVDLAPIFAVVFWGWRATPLVFLYWLENIIVGVATLARILTSGVSKGPIMGAYSVFIGGFFTVHYGLFCLVHGVFLVALASGLGAEAPTEPAPIDLVDPFDFGQLISGAVGVAPGMLQLLVLLIAWQVLVFLDDFVFSRRAQQDTDPKTEMFSPYGRVIVLHIGIFAGFAALAALGEPMVGVLGLIFLRAAWGLFISMRRWGAPSGADANSAGVQKTSV